jgi:predicted nucleic acid-binding protein
VALTVVDADVLAAVLDSESPHHHGARVALELVIARRDVVALPATAYADLLVDPLAAGEQFAPVVDEFLARLDARVVPIDRRVARHAAELMAAHDGFSLATVFLLATACAADASAVLVIDRALPTPRALAARFRVERIGRRGQLDSGGIGTPGGGADHGDLARYTLTSSGAVSR